MDTYTVCVYACVCGGILKCMWVCACMHILYTHTRICEHVQLSHRKLSSQYPLVCAEGWRHLPPTPLKAPRKDQVSGLWWPQLSWDAQGPHEESSKQGLWALQCLLGCFTFFFFLNWSIVNLQYCISFRCTTQWFNTFIDYTPLKVITK